jgi:hypothetical protein
MEEKEQRIYTKLQAGKKYRVFKTVYNDRTFYKVQVTQNNYDGTKEKVYIGVQFKKNIELKNETDIIIYTAYQNYRKNPKDSYNWIEYYVITDFEIVESQEQKTANALDEFRDNLYNIETENEEFDLGF